MVSTRKTKTVKSKVSKAAAPKIVKAKAAPKTKKTKAATKPRATVAAPRMDDPSDRIREAFLVLADEIMPRHHWAMWDRITANRMVEVEQAVDALSERVKELEKRAKKS